MRRIINIGGRQVGDGKPVFVIAEAGVNHNGKLELALKLIDAAAEAGADAVKFQTFKAEDVVINEAEMADYQKRILVRLIHSKLYSKSWNCRKIGIHNLLRVAVKKYPFPVNTSRRSKERGFSLLA